MTDLFNTILTNITNDITVPSALITIASALVFGLVIAFTYYKTQDENIYQRSLAVTLLMLPVILSVIILFVGSNIARAFSLAGTLSIIRFRSAPGDPKDIGFIFFDIAAGLACGVGMFGYGAMFVVILCAVMMTVEKIGLFKNKGAQKLLKITIPEDLNYKEAFDEILEAHTSRFTLEKIKTTDLGSLFEVSYLISEKPELDEQKLINELRCRNGNLTVMLTEAPKA